MEIMPLLIVSLKYLLILLIIVTLGTYFIHALRSIGKKGKTTSKAESKIVERKEKLDKGIKEAKSQYADNSKSKSYSTKKQKDKSRVNYGVSDYSGKRNREVEYKRYRRARKFTHMEVINDSVY